MQILPAWLTTVALSVLLAFVTWSLLRRGAAAFRKETHQLFGAASDGGTHDREPKPTDDGEYKEGEGGSGGEDSGEDGIKDSPRLGSAGGRGALMRANSHPIPVPHLGDHDEFSGAAAEGGEERGLGAAAEQASMGAHTIGSQQAKTPWSADSCPSRLCLLDGPPPAPAHGPPLQMRSTLPSLLPFPTLRLLPARWQSPC